jgi:hypothetical protein
LDFPESNIRCNVLLGLIAELYQANLNDALSVKEWLQARLDEPAQDEPRCTNSYLCQQDNVRWDAKWSCVCNDRCPTCDALVEPFATTCNADQSETIHNQEIYEKANVTGRCSK